MGKVFTWREVKKALRKAGFRFGRQGKGSHEIWVHKDDPSRQVTLAIHREGDTVKKGTLANIERQAGMKLFK
ncbi:type II toxin-antitoxin system HicA family toxin [Staphylospora marina]|uniref:type II toxin-antitoxin system HicA family toxin n=1 Tax=Staphylospora marina TaxID=2490858 RepID=UPI000F5BC56E|nr:type II toxin-antitoxin system HicA family toxin [Staphylospora marina]